MKDKDIVKQAHKRFESCEEAEAENRRLWLEDVKFANGDSDNMYQWEDDDVKARDGLPCLTINKIKQHNLQITNEAKRNRSSPRVVAVDSGADKDTAEIFNGIIRHIEAQSCADIAYSKAFEFAVDGGLGYWIITTDYASNDSFDQEIYVEPVENPLDVYLYGSTKPDGSDARAGFIFKDMLKDEFEDKYPDAKSGTWETLDNGWRTDDSVRVCEYYYCSDKKDTLYVNERGDTILLSDVTDPDQKAAIVADASLKKRDVINNKISWCVIAGDEILETKEWPGKYIPIVRVVGEERVIDGKITRKGHTRPLKDSQKMYNFWNSSAALFVKLQGKQPYIGPAAAFRGYEDYWNTLNSANYPYLPYNHVDDEGNPVSPPHRQEPPVMAQAYLQGMQIANDDIQAASGQYAAQMGENPNQQSGRALNALQRKGDNATFHFTDNSDIAKRFTAKILIDLIPKIYDTKRVSRIIGEDGSESEAIIDPDQPQAKMETRDINGEIKTIYNLSVGRYDVMASTGPSYSTKRQEAAEGMLSMTQANPNIWQTHGDIIVKSQDWPMAEEFAKRFEKTMPPGIIDDPKQQKVDPQAQQMQQQLQQYQQQIQQLDQAIQGLTAEAEDKQGELDIEMRKLQIDEYNAETNRLKVVSVSMTPEDMQKMILQTIADLGNEDMMNNNG